MSHVPGIVMEINRIVLSRNLSGLYQIELRVWWSAGWCDVRPA